MIQHGSGWSDRPILLKCVEFAQEAISGLSLLELAGVNSGAPPQVYDWGGGASTVCQIDREPTVVPSRCFGPTSGPNWSDWSLTPGGWRGRSSGASGYLLHDGEVEGWTYTSGFGAPPPAENFTTICPPASAATFPPHPAAAAATIAGTKVKVVPASPTTTPIPAVAAASEPPTPSPSATSQTLLAQTGPSQPPRAGPSPIWFLLGASILVLAALAAINLPRRGP